MEKKTEKFADLIVRERGYKMVLDETPSDRTIKSLKDFLWEKFLSLDIDKVCLIFDPTKDFCVGTELTRYDGEALILPRKEYYGIIRWLKDNGFCPTIDSNDAENLLQKFFRVKVTVRMYIR